VVLDRKLADRRVWPRSTSSNPARARKNACSNLTLSRVTLLRRSLSELKPTDAMESLVRQLAKYPSNAGFLDKIGQFQK